MKKILAVVIFIAFLLPEMNAQKADNRRGPAIGFGFTINDYTTASRIRTGSVSSVLRDKQWSKFSEGAPGLAVSYFQGLHNHIDLAVTLGGTYAKYNIPSRQTSEGDQFLLQADASAQFKMFPETFIVIPYLSAGMGATLYDGQLGASLPLGVGVRVNILEEMGLFVNSQYRVPLIKDAGAYHFYHAFGITAGLGKKKPEPAATQAQ